MVETQKKEILNPEVEEESSVGLPCQVLLFNDDWHTFEEVITQLQKAVNCSFEKAKDFAFTVHVRGQATVFNGELSRCLKVTSVLEEIALHTQIVT